MSYKTSSRSSPNASVVLKVSGRVGRGAALREINLILCDALAGWLHGWSVAWSAVQSRSCSRRGTRKA